MKIQRTITVFTLDGVIDHFNHQDVNAALKPFYAPGPEETLRVELNKTQNPSPVGGLPTHRGFVELDLSLLKGNRLNWPAVLLYYAPMDMEQSKRQEIDKHIRETQFMLKDFVLLSGQLTSDYFALFIKDDGAEEQQASLNMGNLGNYSEH
ncbi:hypothetical protein Xoosp14_99 [Xanthomonas phage Xoo-sp14]|nr:hypothetical protein Xoosp14_99 [Xanthomonas phage Xoo-sp14]